MIYGVMIMREYAAKVAAVVKISVAAIFFCFCITDATTVAATVTGSIQRCISVVVPSLLAMMIFSSLIVRSGMIALLPEWMGRLGKLLFGMDKGELSIFLFSMVAGYPVGIKMLAEEYTSGRITTKRAELLSGLCFGAGPAFVYGCIARQLFRSVDAGKLILLSSVSAKIIIAFIMSVPMRRAAASKSLSRRRVSISADMLTDCVIRSGRAMADICILITGFSVLTAFLVSTGVMAAAAEIPAKLLCLDRSCVEAAIAALIDITNVEGLPHGDFLLLPFISGAVSFGGLCVLFQLSALTAGKISLRPLVITRTAAAFLSSRICSLLLPFFIKDEAVEATAVLAGRYGVERTVPSAMLILMTIMLIWEFGDKTVESSAYST